ncbi:MAG: hypothetical protein QM687_06375 [Ferruginibacter sp.]
MLRTNPFGIPASLALFIFVLLSCNNRQKKEEQIVDELSISYAASTKELNYTTTIEYNKLENKLKDIRLASLAQIWQPKASLIKDLSDEATQKIDSIQNILTKKNYYSQLPKAENIYQQCQTSISEVDPEINKLLKDITTNHSINNYNQYYLAQIFLSSLKNEIARLQHYIITYCNNRANYICGLNYEKFEAIVGQNTNKLSAGQELIVTAGVGAFTSHSQPQIRINNKEISLNESDVAVEKIRVQGLPGKYTIPVSIEYTNASGEKKHHTYQLTYEVIK